MTNRITYITAEEMAAKYTLEELVEYVKILKNVKTVPHIPPSMSKYIELVLKRTKTALAIKKDTDYNN